MQRFRREATSRTAFGTCVLTATSGLAATTGAAASDGTGRLSIPYRPRSLRNRLRPRWRIVPAATSGSSSCLSSAEIISTIAGSFASGGGSINCGASTTCSSSLRSSVAAASTSFSGGVQKAVAPTRRAGSTKTPGLTASCSPESWTMRTRIGAPAVPPPPSPTTTRTVIARQASNA